MGIVSKSQSGRVCAEPASRPSAPRSGGGAKRRALTSVSTRARCWLDDAASDHNILRSAGVESPSDPRARQHPVILRYGPPSRRAAHPHSINLGRRHSRSPAPRQVGRTARDAARFAGGHGEHKVAEVRFDWGLQEQGGARYTRWECATVRRVDLAGARERRQARTLSPIRRNAWVSSVAAGAGAHTDNRHSEERSAGLAVAAADEPIPVASASRFCPQ